MKRLSTLDVVIAVTAILAAFGIFSLADSYVHPAENQPQYQYQLTPPDGYADFPLSAKYIKVLDPEIGKFSTVMAQDKYGEVHYYTSTGEGYAIIERSYVSQRYKVDDKIQYFIVNRREK